MSIGWVVDVYCRSKDCRAKNGLSRLMRRGRNETGAPPRSHPDRFGACMSLQHRGGCPVECAFHRESGSRLRQYRAQPVDPQALGHGQWAP
jgi:hypothetical protein